MVRPDEETKIRKNKSETHKKGGKQQQQANNTKLIKFILLKWLFVFALQNIFR